MKQKYFYPAIFHYTPEGSILITFPDFPECLTQAKNTEQAYSMAVNALGLALIDRPLDEIPSPSTPPFSNVNINPESDFIALIEFDFLEYKRKTNPLAVKKTVSIPGWLNEAAIEDDINFSEVLQEALKQRLGLL